MLSSATFAIAILLLHLVPLAPSEELTQSSCTGDKRWRTKGQVVQQGKSGENEAAEQRN